MEDDEMKEFQEDGSKDILQKKVMKNLDKIR